MRLLRIIACQIAFDFRSKSEKAPVTDSLAELIDPGIPFLISRAWVRDT
jgi:hypothetical protein